MGYPARTCLLGQQFVPPFTGYTAGWSSGCIFGTVCNNSIPQHQPNESARLITATANPDRAVVSGPSPSLIRSCQNAHAMGLDFARNYTAFLVSLHSVFNGNPGALYGTVG